ncbi:hypothetical protein, partial [Paracoccus hibiscisoli]|uniref:hypothetical protein n=1 Tax=Paracoccus hibiscisoli TaxID=2023261 RepID=UPI0023F3DB46
MIDETWWPDLLRYIADEDPWWGPNVIAADIKSYGDPWTPGSRALWSALVPLDVLDQIEDNLKRFCKNRNHGIPKGVCL